VRGTCPACGATIRGDARFCQDCGTALPASCPRCGAEVAAGARFCAACGQPLAPAVAGEERKVATILFADLVGSTALADAQDPEVVRARLQAYFSAVSTTVETWGGTVEKYIGDAVVAVFGVPRVREDDARRALAAAFEIVERVAALGDRGGRETGALQVRIGVNTGEVVAPTEVRADRPLMTGDAVNVAARLQAAADPGAVLAGERTARQSEGAFRFGDPVALVLKGKTRTVTALPVLGTIAGAGLERPTRRLRSRMVGRERELATLANLLDEAIETRRPRLAVLSGPAGIGKSRLLGEALAVAGSERPDVLVLRGRCPATTQGVAYLALADIVRAACGIAIDDPAGVAGAKLRERVGSALGAAGLPNADVDPTVFALATTASLDLPGNPFGSAPPMAVQREVSRAWPRFVSALAASRPVVVAIEDLHWAGPALVEMLDWIVTRSTGSVLVVATTRPDVGNASALLAGDREDVSVVGLRPLGAAAGRALIEGLIASGLPASVEAGILDTADGNPLFIEEILARLIEDGSLVREDGHWRSTTSTPTALPDTVQGILAARIDALAADEKRLLQEAAVVGRIFWEDPVASAAGVPDAAAALAGLERRGLVSLRPTSTFLGQAEYAFKHAVVRDVAYAGLPRSRRATAHAAVADWLSGLTRDRSEELIDLIAAHYRSAIDAEAEAADGIDDGTRAAIRSRGFEAILAGGSAALRQADVDRALALHGQALELATDEDGRARAFEAIGDDHDAAYHGDAAVPAWDEALAIRRRQPDAADDIARLCRKAAHMGAIRWGGFSTAMDPAAIDRYVDEGLAAGGRDEDRTWLLALRGGARSRWTAMGRQDPRALAERIDAADRALETGERGGRMATAGLALHILAGLHLEAGQVDAAIADNRRTLEIGDRIETARHRHLYLMEAFNGLVWVAGDPASIVDHIGPWHRLGREMSPHEQLHSTYVVIAVYYLLGRWQDLPAVIDEHVETFAVEQDMVCPYVRGGLPLAAVALSRAGDRERARELLALLPTTTAPVGSVEGFVAMARLGLEEPAEARRIAAGVLARRSRDFADEPAVELAAWVDAVVAEEDWAALVEELPRLRERVGLLALAGPTFDRAEGLALAAAGDATAGRALLETAIRGFDRIFPYEAARTREALARLDEVARADLLASALATYVRYGAVPDAERLKGVGGLA
jgi:class 3 adenylate cyclase